MNKPIKHRIDSNTSDDDKKGVSIPNVETEGIIDVAADELMESPKPFLVDPAEITKMFEDWDYNSLVEKEINLTIKISKKDIAATEHLFGTDIDSIIKTIIRESFDRMLDKSIEMAEVARLKGESDAAAGKPIGIIPTGGNNERQDNE